MSFVPFAPEHLAGFEPNRFCKIDQVQNTFLNPECENHTMLDDNGKPLAFVCFKQTAPDEYAGFFFVSVDFAVGDCKELHHFVQQLIAQRGAKRVWTASRQEPELVHWHEFMGLAREGTIVVNGKTCDVWSMTWE